MHLRAGAVLLRDLQKAGGAPAGYLAGADSLRGIAPDLWRVDVQERDWDPKTQQFLPYFKIFGFLYISFERDGL